MTLSADDYAVPAKRAPRIHDASAVRFTWDHVHDGRGLPDNTVGLALLGGPDFYPIWSPR
jgi:hypothetical protein